MNVYDFDKTIYPVDSTVDFWKYCVRRWPKCLRALPAALPYGIGYKLGICKLETFKGKFYRFLRDVPEDAIQHYWDENIDRIYPWYLAQKKSDDLIISASPEFSIGEACRRLGVRYLASPVDSRTGQLLGANCRAAEKVRRLKEAFPDAQIAEAYSDSLSDTPLAQCAKEAFLIQKGVPTPWPKKNP